MVEPLRQNQPVPDKPLTPEESERIRQMLRHIPAWIRHRGLTQRNIAGTLEVSEATVSKWLRGLQGMSVAQFSALAALLQASPEELLLPPEEAERAGTFKRAAAILENLDETRTEQWLSVGEAMADRVRDKAS